MPSTMTTTQTESPTFLFSGKVEELPRSATRMYKYYTPYMGKHFVAQHVMSTYLPWKDIVDALKQHIDEYKTRSSSGRLHRSLSLQDKWATALIAEHWGIKNLTPQVLHEYIGFVALQNVHRLYGKLLDPEQFFDELIKEYAYVAQKIYPKFLGWKECSHGLYQLILRTTDESRKTKLLRELYSIGNFWGMERATEKVLARNHGLSDGQIAKLRKSFLAKILKKEEVQVFLRREQHIVETIASALTK